MNKTLFWRLVEASRRETRGDDRRQEKALEKRLRKLSPSAIVAYGKHPPEPRLARLLKSMSFVAAR